MSDVMIPARPTTYRGIKMRSRLEAKVAAHLDGRGFEWQYEGPAFGGRGGQYLPDFTLPARDGRLTVYIEVKPTVDRAYRAMERMQVIWESEPNVALMMLVGVSDLAWVAYPDTRTWRKLW